MAVLMGGLTLADVEVDTQDVGRYLTNLTSMATTNIGGTTYLYAASKSESAIEIFKLGADGTLTSSGELKTDTTSLPVTGIANIDIVTVGAKQYVVTSAGGSTVNTYLINQTAGANQGNLTVASQLVQAFSAGSDQVSAKVGANSFVVAVNDGRITSMQIGANGGITVKDSESEAANPALPLIGASQVTSFIRDDVTYIATANRVPVGEAPVSDGIGLWRLNANGTLDHMDTEAPLSTNGFTGIDAAVIGDRQFVFAANEVNGDSAKSIVTYEMTAAGTLTFVSECLNVYYTARNMTHFTVDGVTFLATSNLGEDGYTVYGVDGNGTVNFVGKQGALSGSLLNSLSIALYQTPDRVIGLSAAGSVDPVLNGINSFDLGGGNDVIIGTDTADQIIGLMGNDTITGGEGADRAYGGGDKDSLSGEAGKDTLGGGLGDDKLYGGTEADSLSGDGGKDTLEGGTGNDTLQGGGADDQLSGQDGADSLLGDGGKDALNGGAGADTLQGDDGDDVLIGGIGRDVLLGGAGNDSLYALSDTSAEGSAAEDGRLNGGAGVDLLVGTAQGFDVADYSDSAVGVSVDLTGGVGIGLGGDAEGDRLFGINGLLGSQVNDSLTGDSADNRIYGNLGADTINGGDGADDIHGGQQISLDGPVLRDGKDVLFGGTGNDTLAGDGGNDEVNGNTGRDLLVDGLGNDTMRGGADIDTFKFSLGQAGNDIVIDTFTPFAQNRIDLSSFTAFQDLDDVLAATADQRGSAVITLEAGHTVTVSGAAKADLFAGLFIFDIA